MNRMDELREMQMLSVDRKGCCLVPPNESDTLSKRGI